MELRDEVEPAARELALGLLGRQAPKVGLLHAHGSDALEASPEPNTSSVSIEIAEAADVTLSITDVELLNHSASSAVP